MGIDTGQRMDRHAEDRARAAVLEVTKAVLGEVGYQRLRVETVAARAGVPRVWLRRWWTTRPLLVAEALQRMGGPQDVVPTGDARTDVRAVVLRTATFLANPVVGEALAGLAADAARDPVAADRLAALLDARRAGDVAVLLSAVARGDLRPDTDVAMVLDVVYGSLLFRLAGGLPPTPAVVEKLVDLVLAGQAAPADGSGPGYGDDGYGNDGFGGDTFGGAGFGSDGTGDGHGFDDREADGYRLDGNPLTRYRYDGDGDGAHRNGIHEDGVARDGAGQDGGMHGLGV